MERQSGAELRTDLTQIAAREAKRNFHGDTASGIGNLQPLQAYFDGEDKGSVDWNADWGGAFVYHCLQLCGCRLPSRYPDFRVHSCFASAGAWWQYARLPKIRAWHSMAEEPAVGDLIFFQLGKDRDGMVGILLEATSDSLTLAVGNYHNHSAIVERARDEWLLGWMSLSGSKIIG